MPQPPSPPPRKQRVVNFVSPEIADLIFYELRDGRLPKYKNPPAYGTAHPDFQSYPHHKLVLVNPATEADDGWQRWYYARARGTSTPTSSPNGTFTDQDEYNFEIEGDEQLTRTYIIPRAQFLGNAAPYASYTYAAPAVGTADSAFTEFTFREENILRTRDSTIDAYFIVIQRFYYKAEKLRLASETGTARGEEGSETKREADRLAYSIDPGIILQRSSSLTDEELWDNTENRLALRAGVNNTAISNRVGYIETDTSELSETEPEGNDEPQFTKRVVTTDIHGVDAIWAANRKVRATDTANGSEMTTFLGGGIADSETKLVVDTTDADSGFKVLSSQVAPMGGGDAIKTTKELVGDFPVLKEWRYDADLHTMLEITKTVVPADDPWGGEYPGDPGEGGYPGPSVSSCGNITEIQPVDKWRSIMIFTRTISNFSKSTTLPMVTQYKFPAVLHKAYFNWCWAYAFYGANRSEASDVALIFHVSESVSQAVRGTTTRVITCNPDKLIEEANVHSFKPQSHTICFLQASSYASKPTVWAKANARTWQSPLAICSGIPIGAPPRLTSGGQALMTTHIPATSPGGIPELGTPIVVDIKVRRLKLGFWEVVTTTIFSPGPGMDSHQMAMLPGAEEITKTDDGEAREAAEEALEEEEEE